MQGFGSVFIDQLWVAADLEAVRGEAHVELECDEWVSEDERRSIATTDDRGDSMMTKKLSNLYQRVRDRYARELAIVRARELDNIITGEDSSDEEQDEAVAMLRRVMWRGGLRWDDVRPPPRPRYDRLGTCCGAAMLGIAFGCALRIALTGNADGDPLRVVLGIVLCGVTLGWLHYQYVVRLPRIGRQAVKEPADGEATASGPERGDHAQ